MSMLAMKVRLDGCQISEAIRQFFIGRTDMPMGIFQLKNTGDGMAAKWEGTADQNTIEAAAFAYVERETGMAATAIEWESLSTYSHYCLVTVSRPRGVSPAAAQETQICKAEFTKSPEQAAQCAAIACGVCGGTQIVNGVCQVCRHRVSECEFCPPQASDKAELPGPDNFPSP